MALASGDHVGPFTILSSLGAGGMGEVYRARDPQLLRDVAIKILPSAMQHDAVRLARFEREARVIAALSHPNIAAIHGLEQHEGSNALILELVEGETLAARIARAPITVSDALTIAAQIAAALDAAHEKGIVHRDLKPANIVLTPAGLVKVLDFGLATIGAAQDGASEETQTAARTHDGMVVGTPAYMSPEQARGLVVDKRTDIWAFGCVLYEMLTGRRAFDGDSAAEILAFVLTKDVDWSTLPSQTPPTVRAMLRRCLERERVKRLGDVAAIRFALEDVSSSNNQWGTSAPAEAGKGSGVVRIRTVAAATVALLIVAAAVGVSVWRWTLTPEPSPVVNVPIALPPGQRLAGLKSGKSMLAISPNDSYIAYVATAQEEDARQIFLFSIADGTFEPVPGTVGAYSPFFSPDEEWLGFFVQNKLMKIPVKGGVAPVPVAEIVNPFGASWSDDHRIIVGSFGSVLQVVREDGGVPETVTRLKPGETGHAWPYSLPGGKGLLFSVEGPPSTIGAQQISAADGRNTITGQGLLPQYSPSGHLLSAQAGSLVATAFDPARLVVKGSAPTKVLSGVLQTARGAHFSGSARGSMAYVPGGFQPTRINLVRISRNGTPERTFSDPGLYNQPRVGPDGRFVVDRYEAGDPPLWELWLHDPRTNEFNQFTYRTDGDNRHATWLDSNRLVVQSDRKGTRQLFLHTINNGAVQQLTDFPSTEDLDVYSYPVSFCGGALTFVRLVGGGEGWVLHIADSSGKGRTERLNFPMAADGAPSLSPDCRWLAYVSDESGRREVWVRAVSNPAKPQQISKGGGNEPVWNRNPGKRELYFRDGEYMNAVRVSDEGTAEGKPEQLFLDSYITSPSAWSRPNYDVFPDGSFLMLKNADPEQVRTQINLVLNWREVLKRRVPR